MKESTLYRPVAKFLEKKYGCDSRKTWIAGCGKDLAFPSGFGKRKPDVVTVSRGVGTPEVHLVEGKLLNIPTHGFEETTNQLDNVRGYADRLWAAFPDARWRDAAANHEKWKRELRGRGYGLLLLNKEKVWSELEAAPNTKMEPTRKDELLETLLGPQDKTVRVRSLGADVGKAAARAAARVAELMAGPVKEVLAPQGRAAPFEGTYYYDSEDEWFLLGSFEKGSLLVQGDPFGNCLDDGRAVIWVWHSFGDLKPNESRIRAAIAGQQPHDTFFSVEDDQACYCWPISELDIDRLKADNRVFDFFLGRPIPVDDRSKAAVKKDLKGLLSWAKQLGGKAQFT